MGFFSKVWKGLKKGVKKIGKGIKKAVKSVGKFMNKIGIVGQIALAFVLPGIGSAIAGWAAGAAGAGGIIGGVASVVNTAAKFISTGINAFKTVTDAITGFVGTMGKTMINKVAGGLGFDPVFSSVGSSMTESFGKWMQGVADDANNITSPFRDAAKASTDAINSAYDKSTDYPYDEDLMGQAPAPGDEFGSPSVTADNVLDTGNPLSVATEPLQTGGLDQQITAESVLSTADPDQPGFLTETSGEVAKTVQEQVEKDTRTYAQRVRDYAVNTVGKLPEAAIDTVASSVTRGIGTSVMNAITGGPPTPEYTQIYNEIPSFDFGQSEQMYNQLGYQYGTPQQGIEFYAANQGGYGNFGRNAYTTYSQFRTA